MILFSDLHLCEESADVVFGQVLPGVEAAALEDPAREVACLGDFYHLRYHVNVSLQNRVSEVLERWSQLGITLHLLPGNHDQVDVEGRHALEVFRARPGVVVYDEPCWNTHGLWVPFRARQEDLDAALALPRPAVSPPVLFMHQGAIGAWRNNGIQKKDGLAAGAARLRQFKTVLSGHYHKRQNVGRSLFYIGSPYQTRADEYGQAKGITRWDGHRLTWLPRRWGVQFHVVRLEVGGKLDLSGVEDGDEVRVTAAAGVDVEAVARQLAARGIRHVVTPEVERSDARLDVAPGATLRIFARKYVEQQAAPETVEKLWTVFAEITGES